jgi:subtilisin family serine protease
MNSSRIFLITTIYSCCLLILATHPVFAQRELRNFELRAELAQSTPDKMLHLAAIGNAGEIAEAVNSLGGNVVHRTSKRVVFRLPAGAVSQLAESTAIRYLEFTRASGQPMNDAMLIHSRADMVHAGIDGAQSALTGKDVVIGLVDAGIELAHPDFQHADGSTRVKYLWDQTQTGNAPEPYGYGVEWNAAQIDSGITGHQDQFQYFGHGSTVTGTAAGNGLAINEFKGVAPDADLVIVSSKFGVPNWTLSVADAVAYIFSKADELGKPCVVNLSLGSYSGSRDGLDAAALVIDSLVAAQPGRVVVAAAGNSGNWPAYHLGYEVTPDTAFTWFQFNPNSGLGYGAVFFELWADSAAFHDVHFAIGADRVNPSLQFRGATPFRQIGEILNNNVSDTLMADGNILGIVDYFATPRGAQYQVQVHLAMPDSSQYRFRLMTTGQGSFDCWSSSILGTSNMIGTNLPDSAQFPDIANYRAPDKHKHTVGSWACSPKVITVGNFANRDEYVDYNGNVQTFAAPPGLLSVNSSHGPTRDNRLKPEISAPGDITLSTAKFGTLNNLINNEPHKVAQGGMHYRNGGTSMASPVVSGAAALLLEMCPQANYETIRNALLNNTLADDFTGEVPNNAYGNGKINAEAAVWSLYFVPQLSDTGLVQLCEGDVIELTTQNDYTSYLWSSGEETPGALVDAPGTWAVTVMNEAGCLGKSDSVQVAVVPLPEAAIELAWDTILTAFSSDWTYQWLFNGNEIEGAVNHFFLPQDEGSYQVVVSNSAGCAVTSDALEWLFTQTSEATENSGIAIYPNPVRGLLSISGVIPGDQIAVFSADGKIIASTSSTVMNSGVYQLALPDLPKGAYLLRVQRADDHYSIRFISQ